MGELRHAPRRAGRAWRAAFLCLAALGLAACQRVATPVVFHAEGMPATLSEWHLLESRDGLLVPNARVLPYDLNTPLFTDYAHKLRTVWMPEGVAAGYTPDTAFDFPVGTILSKTFYYPRVDGEPRDSDRVVRSDDTGTLPGGRLVLSEVRLVETRLLVHREEGWIALPYLWNAEQTEARLVRGGALVPMTLVDAAGGTEAATYAVPDQNQCAGCHVGDVRSRRLQPIGPKARNLNREFGYAGANGAIEADNQLRHWQAAGYLAGGPDPKQAPHAADWRDGSEPLDARARAYLDSNCGHCHSPTGPGNTSGLWLGSGVTDPQRLGRCKLPIAAGRGTGNRPYGLVPGDPDGSILVFRIDSTDPGVMMPELGRSVVHREGVALVRAWIASQSGGCDGEGNPVSHQQHP